MTVLAQPIATLKDLPSGNEMPEKFLKKSAADLGTGSVNLFVSFARS